METHKAALMGMDHPAVMASLQARLDGRLLALHGVLLSDALTQVTARTHVLFDGALPEHVIAAYAAEAYAQAEVAL